MKKLYIPTSTFNFNNILSSESISPKAFYKLRGFGYSRWLEIPENNIDNVILLYDKPIGFNRPNSEVEDHPLLVEIYSDEDFPQVMNGVCYSDHTIYLSPWRTRFVFFSEQDKRTTLSLSDSSLETKLVGLYKKWFCVEIPIVGNTPPIQLEVKLNSEQIEYDYCINKLKGLLYGYYIGALLSSMPEIVQKANILRELQDIFFSILSSEERSPTVFQRKRLDFLFTELQEKNPLISFLQNQKHLTIHDIEHCIELGMKYPDMIDKKGVLSYLKYSPEEDNPALGWLKKQQDALDQQKWITRKRLEPSAEEIIVADCHLSKISDKFLGEIQENSLMIAWVNKVLSSKGYNGKINSFKEKISDEVTIKAKEIYQEYWEGSETKLLLNQMRKYVRGQENSFQWNNLLVSSIAAVIAKGNDWQQLLAFMQSKSISDYRLAFAFYGELNGFANLTRDFTDHMLNIDDKNYVADVYKELYGQLLGVDPTIPKEKLTANEIEIYPEETDPPCENIALATSDDLQSRVFSLFEDYKCNSRVKNKKKLKEGLLLALEKNGDNQDPKLFLTFLCNYEEYGWKEKNQPWKNMQSKLVSNRKEQIEHKLFIEEEKKNNEQGRIGDLFSNDLINDRKWIQETSKFIDDKKLEKQYLIDANWFIDNHLEEYLDKNNVSHKGVYYGKTADSNHIIDRFSNYLDKKRKNDKVKWLVDIYYKIPIERIIRYLRDCYGN